MSICCPGSSSEKRWLLLIKMNEHSMAFAQVNVLGFFKTNLVSLPDLAKRLYFLQQAPKSELEMFKIEIEDISGHWQEN